MQRLSDFLEVKLLINGIFIFYKGKFGSTRVIQSYTSEIEGSTFYKSTNFILFDNEGCMLLKFHYVFFQNRYVFTDFLIVKVL